jgi:uncharacterized Zn finger protein
LAGRPRIRRHPRQWQQLADARATDQPEQAIPVYQKLVEHHIQLRRNDAYQQAVQHTRRLQALHRRAGNQPQFTTWLAELRRSHRRKRNLMAALDRHGL